MILRRLSQHVRDQNWLAVGLDFLIVVVGVYLGIALGDWNGARKSGALERDYLMRIVEDLERSSVASAELAQRQQDRAVVLGEVMDALRECQAASGLEAERFAYALLTFGRIKRPPSFGPTLDELRSSGQMQLIRDPALRAMLMDVIDIAETRDSIYDHIEMRSQPYIAYVTQRLDIQTPYTSDSIDIENWRIDPALLALDFESACADPTFLGSVSGMRQVEGFIQMAADRNERTYEETIEKIEEALGVTIEDEGAFGSEAGG